MAPKTESPHVVIIGAGLGGISFGIALKEKLGHENFTIYDKGDDVGGTWRDNTYPGCSSDIAIHYYSHSENPNPNWSAMYAYQPEIKAYWQDVARKHALYPHVVFNTTVVGAEWDDTRQVYHIALRSAKGVESTVDAAVLVSALGILEVPRLPTTIPGFGDFKGPLFHSARWRDDVDLRGKRVVVIGNGASATQLVPVISTDASVDVTVFSRRPSWLLPRPRPEYSSLTKWIYAHVPFVMRFHRIRLFLFTEVFWLVLYSGYAPRLRAKFVDTVKAYMQSHAPAEYRDAVMPEYALGCKRVIFDTGYLDALHRPNVHLRREGIARITERGIEAADGARVPADVIIAATGFVADAYPLAVKGRNGTVQEYYDTQGGPTAYLGTTLPGFPNMFVLAGPNTATGHTSVIFTEEVQINYALQLIAPVLAGTARSFEVTAAATDAYNARIQRWLGGTVWATCVSWYRVGGTGKVASLFPGPMALFWWSLRRPVWAHYAVVGGARWARRRRWAAVRRAAVRLLLLAGAVVAADARAAGGLPYVRPVVESARERILPYFAAAWGEVLARVQ